MPSAEIVNWLNDTFVSCREASEPVQFVVDTAPCIDAGLNGNSR